jgi:hypothetical protein
MGRCPTLLWYGVVKAILVVVLVCLSFHTNEISILNVFHQLQKDGIIRKQLEVLRYFR